MRILIVSASHSIHTIKWINSMAELGHEVHLISKVPDQSQVHEIDEKVTVHYMRRHKRMQSVLSSFELRKMWKKIKPDITNTHYASSYGISSSLARIHPNILSVWGSDVYSEPNSSRLVKFLIKKALKSADLITSSSHAMAQQCRGLFENKKDAENLKVEVVPFGVDTEKFSPISAKQSVKHEGKITIGIVKSLEPIYDIEFLIKSFDILIKQLPDTALELKIYGSGSLLESLRDLTQELGIESEVEFCGKIPNTQVADVIREMDIFALSSIHESFGVAAIEAMACSVPVVATAAAGFCEVIADGETGFIVKNRTPEDFAEKLAELVQNPSLRKKLGKAGRERVLAVYDWKKNVLQMQSVYENVSFQCQETDVSV